MSTPGLDALDLGLQLAGALEARSVPYALGGALALGISGVPRGTNDVDVNVFVGPEGLDAVFASLEAVGADFDATSARRQAAAEGMFVATVQGMRVDVFVPSIAFSWEAERTRLRHVVEGREICFLSPEALAVFKLLFFRTKDIADLERLLAVQGERLDQAYVRDRIAEMMGDDDERTRAWERLVEAFGR